MYTAVEFIKTHPEAVIPDFATKGSAGMDLHCVEDIQLNPGQRALVDTGLKIALQSGYEAQVRPRSGLAMKLGVTVLNAPGTIDADYRGKLGVLLINHGDRSVRFKCGDRVAQMVIKPVCTQIVRKTVTEFSVPDTDRGTGGLGSTGV